MTPNWPGLLPLLSGLLLSATIGWLAYRRRALSGDGVVGAIITGTILFGVGGWDWGLLLLTFFISSSLLSRYRAGAKSELAEKFAKGSQRDLGQALANAGVASILALAQILWDHPLLYLGCAGAMAAVNADTWSTEVGVLSRRPPRLITTGRVVDVGTSGGVTGLGLMATLAGSSLIGLAGVGAAVVRGWDVRDALALLLGAIWGGIAGSLFDSLLGATVQAIYWCDRCGKETERPVHRCGIATRQVRGLPWLGNDGVNFLASGVGAAVAVGIGLALMT